MGLSGRANEQAVVLSGGEKQRIGIARAILKNASIIYADEPTASLDSENRQIVIKLLKECALNGAIVILATHDDRLVAFFWSIKIVPLSIGCIKPKQFSNVVFPQPEAPVKAIISPLFII